MNIDRYVMAVAGVFIMSSLLLAHFHNPNWIWFTGFVGLNLFQASLTGFCPLVFILKKAGVKTGQAFN
jgi:hypothetical protein